MNSLTVSEEKDLFNPTSVNFEERQEMIDQERQFEKEERDRVKKSPYNKFVQLNKEMYKAEDWLMAKSPIAYRMFKFLINNMDGYNAVVCSYQVLQEYFSISKDTVRRSVKLLREKKYVDVHKSGTANIYTINKQIAWNSWGSNYKYAKFSANIIISEGEQTEVKAVKHKEIQLKIEELKGDFLKGQ